MLNLFGPHPIKSARLVAVPTLLGVPACTWHAIKRVLSCITLSLGAVTGALMPMSALAETPTSIDMKLLVVTANGKEPSYMAIKSVLDQINVPYDVLVASITPLTSQTLSDGLGAGKYQGILLATGNLAYQDTAGNWQSAFTAAQWQFLSQYETTFKVRQATLYTYPAGLPDNYCLANPVGADTTSAPFNATLSEIGKQVFNYLNINNPVSITGAWTYKAQASPGSNKLTPLLSAPTGEPIVSVCAYPDGRQNLTITADNNPDLLHSMSLGYGIVNWVSKGFFIGARQVYLNAQPDDIMLADDLWDPASKSDTTGLEYRITGADFNKTISWQNNMRARNPALFSNITLEWPFNGEGIVDGSYPDTTLKTAIYNNENEFKWISHTFTHALLDTISATNATNELRKNNTTANSTIGMGRYFRDSMIQPEISGLKNPQFMTAAYNFGIRNLLCDISHPDCLGSTKGKPNTGYYVDRSMLPATATGNILVIPRYAANLYYNVSTPVEWASEYNYFYAPNGLFATFPRAQTITEIINREADNWLRYMIKYSIYSVMFHQTNLRIHDGTNSLLSQLIDATLAKYAAVFALPVQSPSQHDQAAKIIDRMDFDAAGVTGTIKLGATSNSIVFSAVKAAKIPVTGITAGTSVTYGGQVQSTIPITAGGTATAVAPAW